LGNYDGKYLEIDDWNSQVNLQSDSGSVKYDPAMGSLEDYLWAIERKTNGIKQSSAKQLCLLSDHFVIA
jgi:hypothetical protein